MRNITFFKFLIAVVFFAFFSPVLEAEDRRVIPLDLYVVIDGSTAFKDSKNDAVAWFNEKVADRILMEGDRISVWTAGDQSRMIFSDTISAGGGKQTVKEKLSALDTAGKSADFAGALRELSARVSQTPEARLAYTMLITASARVLEPALAGSSQGTLRWFRSEKYERWQVLVVAPNLGQKVRQAAGTYMASLR